MKRMRYSFSRIRWILFAIIPQYRRIEEAQRYSRAPHSSTYWMNQSEKCANERGAIFPIDSNVRVHRFRPIVCTIPVERKTTAKHSTEITSDLEREQRDERTNESKIKKKTNYWGWNRIQKFRTQSQIIRSLSVHSTQHSSAFISIDVWECMHWLFTVQKSTSHKNERNNNNKNYKNIEYTQSTS